MGKRRECARCGREQSDTARICHRCAADLRRTLAHIRNLWSNLLEAIGKQTAMGERSGHKPTKASEQPLPVDMHASAVADRARATLTGWCRVLVEDNHLTPPPNTIPAICDWLSNHMGDLRRHEAAVEAAGEITYTSGEISRAVDYRDEKARIFVGPCPETVEEGPCSGEIYAHIPRDQGGPFVRCKACGAMWDATQWARMGARVDKRKKQVEIQKSYGRDPMRDTITEAVQAGERKALRLWQLEHREPCDECEWEQDVVGTMQGDSRTIERISWFCEKHGGAPSRKEA